MSRNPSKWNSNMTWNNPEAAALSERFDANREKLRNTNLHDLINAAQKAGLMGGLMGLKNKLTGKLTQDDKPEMPTIVASMLQDFLHDSIVRYGQLAMVIDALVLDFPSDKLVAKDERDAEENGLPLSLLAKEAEDFLVDKIGRENFRSARNSRTIDIAAAMTAYCMVSMTNLLEEEDPEVKSDIFFSVNILFMETVLRQIEAFSKAVDIRASVEGFMRGSRDLTSAVAKLPNTNFFAPYLRNEMSMFEPLAARAKEMVDEGTAIRARAAKHTDSDPTPDQAAEGGAS